MGLAKKLDARAPALAVATRNLSACAKIGVLSACAKRVFLTVLQPPMAPCVSVREQEDHEWDKYFNGGLS